MLEKLKQYQEIITVIIFFLSGFFWLQTQFPQKTDLEATKQELKQGNEELTCKLDVYISLTQYEIQVINLGKKIEEKERNLANLRKGLAKKDPADIDESILQTLTNLEIELQSLKNELAKQNAGIEQTKAKIDAMRLTKCKGGV